MFFLDKETEVCNNLVPVGYAVADNDVLLLDDSGAQVAGDEGEIAVRTRYVSPDTGAAPISRPTRSSMIRRMKTEKFIAPGI